MAQPIMGKEIRIPFAMRAALGWHTGAKLVCWTHHGDLKVLQRPKQMSISAYMPNSRELWHLAARFHDRLGLLADLTAALADLQIDVIGCRASTQFHHAELRVDLDIDTSAYESEFDLTRQERLDFPARRLRELHARLLCLFIKDIVFFPDGKPILRITRNPLLRATVSADSRHDILLRAHGLCELPRAVLDEIELHFAQRLTASQKARAHDPRPLVMLAADARWGVVDATIFYRNTGYRHIRVNAADQSDTLQLVTSQLKRVGFNILQLYSRAIANTGRIWIDLLVHLADDRAGDDARLMAFIRGVFRDKSLRSLALEATFPRPMSRRAARRLR
ncbi:MAG: hypothetical protein AABO58_09300 [Acidobacteriota bacterium]